MIDSARLESSLIHVARRYAPSLVPAGWQKPGDYPGVLPDLARALASYNVLVMAADVPLASIKLWTDGYSGLYGLIAGALFPSFVRVSAFYVDQQPPPIVGLYGEATPIMMALAGYIVPYVVARQGSYPTDVELLGVMDMILEELEATDLPRDEYRRLRDGGAALVRSLLDNNVHQFAITSPARAILEAMAQRPVQPNVAAPNQPAPPPQPADLPEPPLPPDTMPEEIAPPQPNQAPPQRSFDPDAVPLFFNPTQGGTNLPAPPVPPLPPRSN